MLHLVDGNHLANCSYKLLRAKSITEQILVPAHRKTWWRDVFQTLFTWVLLTLKGRRHQTSTV